jgi:hypothetical protein
MRYLIGKKIPLFTLKIFTISYLFISIPGFLNFLIEDEQAKRELYPEVIYLVLDYWAWSILWAIVTFLVLFYNATASYLAFIFLNIMMIFLGTSYALMTFYAKYFEEAKVSIMSIGVWISLAFMATTALFYDNILLKPKKKRK